MKVLCKDEAVHHIDEDRSNNDIDNLMLFNSNGEHTKHHHNIRKGLVIRV